MEYRITDSFLHYSSLHCPIFSAGPQGAIQQIMNNVGHLPLSETAARRVGSTKARRGRPRKTNPTENVVREPAAVGTLTRTKSLLLAALRVWELKHRISE
jgi:hypothetical protein